MEELSTLFNHFPGPKATKTKIEDYIEAILDDPEDLRSLLTLLSMIIDDQAEQEEQLES
jgi:hypothetical protein